jgi:integrase
LGTSDPKLAQKKRDLEDLKFNAVFDKLRAVPCEYEGGAKSLSPQAVVRMVQDYVEGSDSRAKTRELEDPVGPEAERAEIRQDIEHARSILKNDDDPNGRQWLYAVGTKLLGVPLHALDAQSSLILHEILRRGLLELGQRRELRLDNDFSRSFVNPMFGPQEQTETTFGEIADQLVAIISEEARANGTSAKWIDAQRANIALLKEIVGAETPISRVDYDVCMNVRNVLGAIPANRNKLYPKLDLDRVIQLADQQGKRKLSAVTQGEYLSTFRNIMALGFKKRVIPSNPAEGLRPITRETVKAKDRRDPFTSEQLKSFFRGGFYQKCAQARPDRPYLADQEGWRFWMPLLALFMGFRGNEICQLQVGDVEKTPAGTWFISVAESADEEKGEGKRVKTETSTRKVPVHPEILAIGFIDVVFAARANGQRRLFATLKPDKYGYYSKYALRRFNEAFFPAEFTLGQRQSFHSFRHNFRDALRAAEIPPDGLKGLGGWSQRGVVSDDYGDAQNPDFLFPFVQRVHFSQLDLNFLRIRS